MPRSTGFPILLLASLVMGYLIGGLGLFYDTDCEYRIYQLHASPMVTTVRIPLHVQARCMTLIGSEFEYSCWRAASDLFSPMEYLVRRTCYSCYLSQSEDDVMESSSLTFDEAAELVR